MQTHSTFVSTEHNLMEVTGQGTVTAAPDRAVIILGTFTENISLHTAQRENAETVTSIIDALLRLSIPKDNIQTETYTIEPQYSYEEGKQTFRGYKVTHLLRVTVEQISLTGQVVDTAVSAGANQVSGVRFTTSGQDAYYNQALANAIEMAKQKALTIARALGVTLNRIPDHVEELLSPPREPIPYPKALLAESVPTPIEPGQLQIRAWVKLRYSYAWWIPLYAPQFRSFIRTYT